MSPPSKPSDPPDSPDADSFADDTRRLLQRRLTLVFAVFFGVSLFYSLSAFIALALAGTLFVESIVVPSATLAIGIATAGSCSAAGAVGARSPSFTRSTRARLP